MTSLIDVTKLLPPPEPNPLARRIGITAGKTCATCAFLLRMQHHDKYYLKCRKRGVTHGAGTDHRKKWNACAYYQEERE